ncbi:MAG TPA: cyclase family protein [Nitrospiraceae bacterium]|jgi:kynurenine formamidase|nr:cyclase family protein [Nitrospiraceae bacterium]
MTQVVLIGILVAALHGCATTQQARPARLVDLSYPFDEHTIYWPNNAPFRWEKSAWGMTAAGYWYASAAFSTSEHGGTHLDAPIHFAQNRTTVDRIPLQHLTGPAVVIDARAQCDRDPDYALTVQDIAAWESRFGAIPDGAIVFMWSGWGRRWPDRVRYLGSETPDDPRTLHFPGFSPEAAEFLVTKRKIHGAAIDTASIDAGRVTDFPVHQILNGAEVYALENIADLDRVPATGATVMALPMKIKGGTGAPARVIAWVPQSEQEIR